MPRLVFFVEDNWVFGKIFRDLTKHLFPHYDADMYDWGQYMAPDVQRYFNQKYAGFVSTPVGCFFLHQEYGTPLERCYAHAHSEFDIDDALRRFPAEWFQRLGGYGVVSGMIAARSQTAGVPRTPELLPVGVTAANYARDPQRRGLTTLGYFGRKYRSGDTADGKDIKRGYLAEQVAAESGLTLVQRENIPFTLVDQAYTEIDLTLFCSLTEGNPYMALESMAAGIPVLGTNVGVFPELAVTGAGIVLPMDEAEFVKHAVTWVRALQRDERLYNLMCAEARRVGAQRDWAQLKNRWLEALAFVSADRYSRPPVISSSDERTLHDAAAVS